jgi:hypothetical protein
VGATHQQYQTQAVQVSNGKRDEQRSAKAFLMSSIYDEIRLQVEQCEENEAKVRNVRRWRQRLGNAVSDAIKRLCNIWIEDEKKRTETYRSLNGIWCAFYQLQYGDKLRKPPRDKDNGKVD